MKKETFFASGIIVFLHALAFFHISSSWYYESQVIEIGENRHLANNLPELLIKYGKTIESGLEHLVYSFDHLVLTTFCLLSMLLFYITWYQRAKREMKEWVNISVFIIIPISACIIIVTRECLLMQHIARMHGPV